MSDFKAKLPLFVFLGLLLIGALYYSMVYVPVQKSIDAMREETLKLEREVQYYDLYVQEIGALRGRVESLRQEMDSYQGEYFRVHGKTILAELHTAFNQTGVKPSQITVGEPSVLAVEEGARVLSLPVSVELYGAYEQVSAFIKFFEEAEFSYFRVLSVEMGDLLRSANATVDFVLVYPQKRG